MKTLRFSNGVIIDATQIAKIESNQQSIDAPGAIGELQHLLKGRPSTLTIHLKDSSQVVILAGQSQLQIHESEISFE